MRNSLVILYFLLLVIVLSCSAQTDEKDTTWRLVESPDAGFEAMFPCDPKVSKKLYQETPKTAHAFSYECSFEGVKFSVSLPERFGDFDPEKSKESLDSTEVLLLREGIGEIGRITAKDTDSRGYLSREFEVDSGNVYGRQLQIEHPRGQYGVQGSGKYERLNNRERISGLVARFIGSFRLSE